jgi:hypothetical protein
MVLISKSKQELQEAFNDFHNWFQENDFISNEKKTASMIFTKGRKLTDPDFICCKGERLKNINSSQYLGVTLHTTSKTFKQHVKDKAPAALRAMHY